MARRAVARRSLAFGAFLLLASCLAVRAQVWNGAGANDVWSNSTNWSSGSAPVNNGTASIILGGSTRLTPSVDANWDVLRIVFSNTAGAFILGGSQLTVRSNGIVNNDADLQTINNNIVMNGAQSWNAASGNLLFGGTVDNGGSLLTISGAQSTTISGVISGTGGLTQSGTGTLTLSGANTFSGTLTLSAGTLAVGHDTATGSGGLTISGGTIQASGGARAVGNVVTASGNFAIGGSSDLTFNNSFVLSGADRTLTVNNAGTTTISGQVGETAGSLKFIKAGTGTLVLTASNALQDEVTVSAGVLNIRHSNALDSTANKTKVESGAALELQGGIAVGAEALELKGSGVSTAGALRNISGDNSWAGSIKANDNITIGSDSGTLTLSGTVDNNKNFLTTTGAGNIVLSGAVTGEGGLTKSGSGSLTLSGTSANDFLGDAYVNEGTLLLNKTAGIDALAVKTYVGDGSGGAEADVMRWLASNQVKDDKEVHVLTTGLVDLNGYDDKFKLKTMTGGKVTTGAGTLTLGDHLTTVATNATAVILGNVNLGANRDFTVNDSSVDTDLHVGATLSGAYSLDKLGAGTLVLGGANTFSGGVNLTAGTLGISNNLALGTGTFTVAAGTSVRAEGAARTVTNALTLASFTIGGSQDLTFSGISTYAADIVMTVDNTGLTTFSGALSSGKKIYKEGNGTLIFSADNNQAETYVNAGVLNVRHAGALGTNKKTVVANGAALETQGGIAMVETLELYGSGIGGAGALRNISGNNSWGGAITMKAASTIASDADTLTIGATINNGGFAATFAGAGNTTVNGVISGTGSLTKNGTGTLALNATNTFSGGATINAGTVAINNNASLGSSAVAATINAGTLRATENITSTRNFTLGSSSSGIEVDASKTFTVSGVMSGTGGLVKTGNGTLIVSGANTFTGNLNINAGTLQLGNNNRISDGVAVSMNGGVLNSGGYSETVGALTLTANSIIDFGNAASVLHFANSLAAAWTPGTTLTITNWNGNWMTGGGTDQLFFGSDATGLSSSQLAQIRFADPNGYYTGVAILSNGEVVPVPEPATIIATLLVAGLIGYRERKTLLRLAGRTHGLLRARNV